MADIAPRLLTAQAVAGYLGVSVPTVKRMAERGDLPKPIRLSDGGKRAIVRWDRLKIDDYLNGKASGYDDPDEALARGEEHVRKGRAAAAGRR